MTRVGVSVEEARYMVDPGVYCRELAAFSSDGGEYCDMLTKGKRKYLAAFMAVMVDEAGMDEGVNKYILGRGCASAHHHGEGGSEHHDGVIRGTRCPVCGEREVCGPLSLENQGIVRCKNARCRALYCAGCLTTNLHKTKDCPVLVTKVEQAKKEDGGKFDPMLGRACPYPGCTARGIQHYRDEGCHLMTCPACGGTFCFVCGLAKQGDRHTTLGMNPACMTCPIICNADCPCVPNPSAPAPVPSAEDPIVID